MGNVEKMSKGIQFPNIECQLVLFLDLTLNTVFDHINCRDVALFGRVWRIGRVDTFRPKGHWFDSRLSRHLGTMRNSQLPVALQCEIWEQYPCCVWSASE